LNNKAKSVTVCEGFGSWLEFVAFINDQTKEPELMWHVDMHKPDWSLPQEQYVLESDGGLRGDSIKIREKDIASAEKIKHGLEEQQRKDKRLRQTAKERRDAAAKQSGK
jgi:hypothetical protein